MPPFYRNLFLLAKPSVHHHLLSRWFNQSELTVLILATSKGGFFTRGVEKSINMMFDSVEDMATEECLGTIDDVNGKWSGWSGWAGCAWDAVSSTCLEYSTHACNSPNPKCGGSQCQWETDAARYTTDMNPTESKSQACYIGSWVPGSCVSACTGGCGSTVGTCALDPDCDTGCCDPADKPAMTTTCVKPEYPDEW